MPDFPTHDLNLEGVFDRKILADAIEQLPPSYRTVLVMRLIEGRSIEETCQTLGIKGNAVKSRLFRSRQILKEILVSKGRTPIKITS